MIQYPDTGQRLLTWFLCKDVWHNLSTCRQRGEQLSKMHGCWMPQRNGILELLSINANLPSCRRKQQVCRNDTSRGKL